MDAKGCRRKGRKESSAPAQAGGSDAAALVLVSVLPLYIGFIPGSDGEKPKVFFEKRNAARRKSSGRRTQNSWKNPKKREALSQKTKEPEQAEEAAKRCAACSFSFGSFNLFVLVSVPAGGKRPLTEYMHPCGVGFIKLCGRFAKAADCFRPFRVSLGIF